MIREVNLISHLPLHTQDYREIQGIMNAEEPELQLVEDVSETIKNNMFVISTDEVGINRYEKMFGITPSKDNNVHERQMNVLSYYTNNEIYTFRGLIDRLNVVCGVDNYTLKLIPDEYIVGIELYPRVENLLETVSSMIVGMIPANMQWTCVVICNRHNMIAKYPLYLLEQFTHQEMYEETIDDYISSTCSEIANHTAESIKSIYCEHVLNYGMRKV